MWNTLSNHDIPELNKLYKPHTQRMVASEFMDWMLDVYFELMADMEMLGITGLHGHALPCELSALPTGTHAVFMAAISCETVHMFGFVHQEGAAQSVAQEAAYDWEANERRNWEFDRLVLRLLHLAGQAYLCS